MAVYRILFAIFLTTIFSACNLADLNSSVTGKYDMKSGDYRQAIESFKHAVENDPENTFAHYYLGRFLLAQDKPTEALTHLKQAVNLNRTDADFYFWLGISYGESGDDRQEWLSYEKALQINKNHLQANLHMGHLQLKAALYAQAITSYETVLQQSTKNRTALYNRALALDLLGNRPAAREAWLRYLKTDHAGRLAFQATVHLNSLGDFAFENHFFGIRSVTLAAIKFQRKESKVSTSSYPSLRLVGALISNLEKGTLQVIVYKSEGKQLALERAAEVKETLATLFPALKRNRIQVSWFGTPEKVVQGKNVFLKNESVRFFLTDWK